ncbi:MAG: metallophosphoesterase family protein [Ardenticatenaceae bacterium]|nr:metallophosphoesterase family protein [Anaerolineales bacterium]MCB8920397.1 metallophosphoesterase family protein [Ardenticatenaceae bacterium]MCB8989352.1 metallophosphoesterase family protein [Ardenticatenaceae bacterium]MCB9004507.1 metallophosphoesterase family protein [Ardenticatenaceae bacterium]
MKIAVLSDIHGNLPALQTVAHHIEQWHPDHVVVAGDFINRGPQSPACWQLIQTKAASQGWQIIKGNHEDYVISHQQPQPTTKALEELSRVSKWTYQQLNGAVNDLAALPDQISLADPNGDEVRVCHASMSHNRDGLYSHQDEATLRQKIAPSPAVFITAHTHMPFVRPVNGCLIVNAGSVGTPADGDGRASYTQLTYTRHGWQATIIRLPYNYDQTKQDYYEHNLLTQVGPFSWLVYHEWLQATYLIPNWMNRYWPHVLAQTATVEQTVRAYLAEQNLPIPINN